MEDVVPDPSRFGQNHPPDQGLRKHQVRDHFHELHPKNRAELVVSPLRVVVDAAAAPVPDVALVGPAVAAAAVAAVLVRVALAVAALLVLGSMAPLSPEAVAD
jgi:hypothetical protein